MSQLITTLERLIVALHIPGFQSSIAQIRVRKLSRGNIELRVTSDTGKGSSKCFPMEFTPIANEVFEEALRKAILVSVEDPGYLRDIEFEATEYGKRLAADAYASMSA